MKPSLQPGLHAPPRAWAMVEALRGLGYTPATALADIIDNSIAAGADAVDVQFHWEADRSWISVRDNGSGMDGDALFSAMRLGDRNPLEVRAISDLGRFGLGLKTASFSQARRLTVQTADGHGTACLRWDLDLLAAAKDDGWYLQEGPAKGSEGLLQGFPPGRTGTLVLWEVLDRIVTPGFKEGDFLDLIDVIESHLAMVFHRFLAGHRPRLKLQLNGARVEPWDPFLSTHPATWSSPVERLQAPGGQVEVQCHVLPHKDKLTPDLHERAAGPDGWTAQQGFYVYRNERLLLAGNWLGLGRGRAWTKEEAHRLARIRIDIANSADHDWKIDIRKSVARPPVVLRERLVRLAEDTRVRARRVFAHRGGTARKTGEAPVVQVWRADHFKGGIRYCIDEEHPAVQAVMDQAGDLQPLVRVMLRTLEETIPVQRIWLDTTEAKETPRTCFAGAPRAEVLDVLRPLYRNMILRKGMSPSAARLRLKTMEPFDSFPDFVDGLPEDPDKV